MCTCVFMQFSLRFCTLQEIPQFLKRRNWQHFKNHHGLVQGSVLFNSRLAFLRFSDSANLILLSYHCLFNWWFIYLKYFYILIMAAQWIVYFKSIHCFFTEITLVFPGYEDVNSPYFLWTIMRINDLRWLLTASWKVERMQVPT